MNIKWILLALCLLATSLVTAQTSRAFLKAGDKAFEKKDYYSALRYYQEAYEINTKKLELAYKIAEVAREFFAYEIADDYYKKVYYSPKKKEFPLLLYRMGETYKFMGQYDMAQTYLKQFLKEQPSGRFSEQAKVQLEECQWAADLIKQEDDVKVSHLNKRVNTPYSEFGPVVKGDTLFYSSLRYDNYKDEHSPSRKYTKVLQSIRGGRGRPISRGFNDKQYHTAHMTFGNNGQTIYYTLCEYVSSVDIRCAIYARTKGKRRRWSRPKKLPDGINMPGFTTTQPNIGYDSINQREVLYFASDRKGGQGKMDIWYALPNSQGKFVKAQNLKSLNTPDDDATPFFHNSSQTLYFSTKGRKGLGGYDVYKAGFDGKNWQEPKHGGYPLNSSYNDVYFSLNQDSTVAYLASNRAGSFYLEKENKSCCNDIYKMQIFKDTTEKNLVPDDSLTIEVDTPTVADIPPIPPKPAEPVPTTLEDFLPLALYFHNDEPDRRTRRTTTRKTYEQTYFDYYALKPTYLREYTNPLPETVKYQAEQELENFFEFKVRKGYDYLILFSEILLRRLKQGEKVEIFVKGFTSPRAKSDYNLSLGKRRVSSVRNHFDTYQNGIFKSYLKNGKLIISERSFGETTASKSISDDLLDLRNSVYSVGAASERRVEIVEIKRE
ncbi:MAG: hypothetical protein AAF990_21185 [Bacteroidota bacterium]